MSLCALDPELLDQVFAVFPVPVVVFDASARLVGANPAALHCLCGSHADLLACAMGDIAPDFTGEQIQTRWRALRSGERLRWIGPLHCLDGTFHAAEIEVVCVSRSTGLHYVATLGGGADPQTFELPGAALSSSTDATSANGSPQNSAQLEWRTMELGSVDAMRARFLASVSHELRTPLHTLLGYLRLALNISAGEARSHLELAERSGFQLLQQIGDSMNSSLFDERPGKAQTVLGDLEDLVEQVRRAGHILAQASGSHFVVHVAPDVPTKVLLDTCLLLQVFNRLISSFCKHTRGGMLSLRVERASGFVDPGSCRLLFSVMDHGMGYQGAPVVFNPLERGAEAHFPAAQAPDFAIARQLVRAMGSDIHVDSARGQGNRFWFVLELDDDEDFAQRHDCTVFAARIALNAPTVLVVDPVADSRQTLRRVCEQWGCRVLAYEDTVQALEFAAGPGNVVDIVLLDQFVPSVDAWELLRQVRSGAQLPGVAVVLISSTPVQRPVHLPESLDFDLIWPRPLDYQRLECLMCQRQGLANIGDAGCGLYSGAGSLLLQQPLEADDLATLRKLLHQGRVVRILEWAHELLATDACHAPFCERVTELAAAADLGALDQLVTQAEWLKAARSAQRKTPVD